MDDIRTVCEQLNIAHKYENIKKLFENLRDFNKGGLVIEDVKEFLLNQE